MASTAYLASCSSEDPQDRAGDDEDHTDGPQDGDTRKQTEQQQQHTGNDHSEPLVRAYGARRVRCATIVIATRVRGGPVVYQCLVVHHT